LADAGVENVNAQVDELITTGVLRRVLAFTELRFSNSMIEAWWRSLHKNISGRDFRNADHKSIIGHYAHSDQRVLATRRKPAYS
jgi:hypothetical protein